MIKNIPFKNGKKASQVGGSCCSWHLFTNTLRWKVTISGSSVDNINILEKRVAFKNWKEKCDFLNALFCDVNGSWKVSWWVLPRVNYIKTDLPMHCWFSATYSYLTITNLGKNAFFFNREPNIQCDSSCWVKTHFELQDICRRNFYNYLLINY